MSRLDKDRERVLQPKRMQYASNKIAELGYSVFSDKKNKIWFFYKGHEVALFPYSGWHTGKSINDGRGLQKLLDQIK